MLPAGHRLRHRRDFAATIRQGRRARTGHLVVHWLPEAAPTRVGFVVSKSVGVATVRNRTRRRLQHAVAARWCAMPDRTAVVIRALPGAAQAQFADLDRDLARALHQVSGEAS